MSRRDYHDWYYHLEDDDGHLVSRNLVDRKGVPKMLEGYVDIEGRGWRIWYVEEGRRVRNARLERAPELDQSR